MMKYKRNIAYLCAATLAFGLMGIADADASTARRASLAGNRLVLDREDVFAFPQLATQYANLAGFDYGSNSEQGNALLIMGDEGRAFGVSLHRGNLFASEMYLQGSSMLSGPNSVLDAPNSPFSGILAGYDTRTGNIVDVFGGYDIGGGLVGARLVLGNGGVSENPANDALDDTSVGEFYTVLQLGYSTTGHLAIDTALNIKFSTMSVESGDDTPLSGSLFDIGLDGRGIYEMRGPLDVGFMGGLNFSTRGMDTEVAGSTTTSNSTGFAVQAGVGPVWRLNTHRDTPPVAPAADDATLGTPAAPAVASTGDGTTIAAYALLGYQMSSYDPDDKQADDGSGMSKFILPGAQIAADIELLEWLYFRTGAQYHWAIGSSSAETSDGDDTASRRGPGANSVAYSDGFGWSTGLGVKVGDFRFDGTFANNFLLDGPNFIGGGSGFLSTASAEYSW